MADFSLIEFIVYGLIGYSGILLLIISAFKNPPAEKKLFRVMWLIPSIFALSILSTVGPTLILEDQNVINTIYNNQTNQTDFTEDITRNTTYTLQQPVWATFHILLFLILVVYVVWNILMLLLKPE